MFIQKCKRASFAAAACAAAIVLSGCGGGGGGGTSTSMDPSERFGFLRGNAQSAIAEAAGNTPNAGSVTQSSNADSGITADSVSVAVTRGTDGTVTFRVNEAGGWTVDGDSARVLNGGTHQEGWSWAEFHQAPDGSSGTGTGPGLYVDVYTDIEAPTVTAARCGVGRTVSAGSPCVWEANGQRFTLSIESGSVCFRGGALNSCAGGNQILRGVTINGIPLTLVTEGSGTSRRITALSENLMLVGDGGGGSARQDADYLAGGIWVRVPADATSVADYEFGAFVDGNDPFQQSNLAGLTGEVTYSGDATVVYSVVSTERNYFPDATASLTARFGDGTALGTIEGRIHDITGDGPASDSYDGVAVNLGRAAIGDSNSGFFTGDTSTTGTDSDFTGKWGGQFYGNGATATAPPGSVAGTFGAATANGGESFVGIFGAYRRQQ